MPGGIGPAQNQTPPDWTGPVDFSAPPVDVRLTPDGRLSLGSTHMCPDPSFLVRPGSAFHVGFRLLLPDGSWGSPVEVDVVVPPGRRAGP